MPAFDADKALSDETYWFPKSLYNDDGTFILTTTDMAALNKYIWAGRLLPVAREEYVTRLGITNSKEIQAPLWQAVDGLLKVYAEIKPDCEAFHKTTWPRIVDLASDIYNYATNAGGKTETSYYASMLDWVRQYNNELNEDHPDKQTLDDLKSSILTITKKQIRSIDKLRDDSQKAKADLVQFETACRTHHVNLGNSKKEMENLLEGEGGEIKRLKAEMEEVNDQIKNYNDEIESDREVINGTPAYSWVGLNGLVVSAIVIGVYTDKIEKLKKAIKAAEAILDTDNKTLQTDIRLETDIHVMKDDIGTLVSSITAAISTLGKLEGAWEVMSGDLQGLHDLVSEQSKEIPPVMLEKVQLNNIVEHWNTLAKFADQYRQVAYVSEPEIMDPATYLEQLENVKPVK